MFTSEPRHFLVFRIHLLWELSILQIIPNIKVFVIKSVHMLTNESQSVRWKEVTAVVHPGAESSIIRGGNFCSEGSYRCAPPYVTKWMRRGIWGHCHEAG